MWEKLAAFILSTVIPASVFGLSAEKTPPPLKIDIEPLSVVQHQAAREITIGAKAALAIETHSNEALYTKNVWELLPIASLTKLMTALVVKESIPLDQVVTVGPIVASVGGSSMGLRVGEQITVDKLLHGLLINSGNDAAMVLAEAVAGSTDAFVALMNERKLALGLNQTQFVDPAGLSEGNLSSAFEIAHLAKYVFRDPVLQTILRQKEVTVASVDGAVSHHLMNTDRLLGTALADRIIAGKTGTTPLAGQCLISFFNIQDTDRTTMVIILGSKDRYAEMNQLIPWIDETYRWE
ncbi:MAG: serine hydrolase [bacterium]|nr:serine hydrolase [bacterium]